MKPTARYGGPAALLVLALTAGAQADGVNIVVMDVARVFEQYQMTRDLETKFSESDRALGEEAERRRSGIEQMRRGLAAFDPAGEDFARREGELMKAEVEFQVWLGYEKTRLRAEHSKWMLQIYRSTKAAVAETAQKRNIDLVLTYDRLAEDTTDSDALKQRILLEKVIYHSDRVDITDEVLDRLNNDYRAAGGARSLGPAPPVSRTDKTDKD